MSIGASGYGIGSAGTVILMILVALALSVARYHLVTRPREERERTDAREAAAREFEAAHENDVPL